MNTDDLIHAAKFSRGDDDDWGNGTEPCDPNYLAGANAGVEGMLLFLQFHDDDDHFDWDRVQKELGYRW